MKFHITIFVAAIIFLLMTDEVFAPVNEKQIEASVETIPEWQDDETLSRTIYIDQTNYNYILVDLPNEKRPERELTDNDVYLIALITIGEAEGEGEYGKRLVIDTILNRVDSSYFPNTVSDVIYQPSQFSCVWDGRLDRCSVTDEVTELVKEEAFEQTNHEVMFFTAGDYGKYGKPMFKEGNHYFCSYE